MNNLLVNKTNYKCGSIILRRILKTYERSKKHINYINSLKINLFILVYNYLWIKKLF